MPDPCHWLTTFMEEEKLPPFFRDLAIEHYLPLAERITHWEKQSSTPLVVGVNGAQGTGKSTLSAVLKLALQHKHGLKVAVLSIDDLYLTHNQRQQLARTTQPLLATRGVPGTHDIVMGIDLIHAVQQLQDCVFPVFDKATDDRAPEEQWKPVSSAVDVLLFEGWCIGAIPQDNCDLTEAVNTLEANEDPDAAWRTYVNDKLAGDYQSLFALIDRLVMLKAPDFDCIRRWRQLQESKLREAVASEQKSSEQLKIMTAGEIDRFIMHYERITRWMFEEMPSRADCVIELTEEHTVRRSLYQEI